MKALSKFDRNRVTVDFDPAEGMTKQEHKKECDINQIMKKYQKTGLVTHLAKHGGVYGFAPTYTYQEAMNELNRARDQFMDLPSSVRTRFENDPGKFLEFATNPQNIEELRKMGLAKPATPPTVSKADTGTPPPPAGGK